MSRIDTPPDRNTRTPAQEWKLLPLIALALACCALPAIVASLAAIGALAWTLGLGAAAAVAAGITVVWIARRRSKPDCVPNDPQPTRHGGP